MRKYSFDLNGPRGLAAFGIVMGHVAQAFARYRFSHYDNRFILYIGDGFGVPCLFMFMLLAGIANAMMKPPKLELREYLRFERKKFLQLFVPYLSVSLLTLVVKVLAPGKVITLSEAPYSVLYLFLAPRGGPSAHLWFLYWLMSVFVIWPFLKPVITRQRLPFLLAASFLLAIQPIEWPTIGHGDKRYALLGLPTLVQHFPVFVFGYYYGLKVMSRQQHYLRYIILTGIGFAGWMYVFFTYPVPESYGWAVGYRVTYLVGNTCAGLFLLWLVGLIAGQFKKARRITSYLAVRAYDVYLLHLAFAVHPIVFAMSRLRPDVIGTIALFIVAGIIAWLVSLFMGSAIRRIPILGAVLLGVPMRRHPAKAGQASKT